jgi:hypothetical protein
MIAYFPLIPVLLRYDAEVHLSISYWMKRDECSKPLYAGSEKSQNFRVSDQDSNRRYSEYVN